MIYQLDFLDIKVHTRSAVFSQSDLSDLNNESINRGLLGVALRSGQVSIVGADQKSFPFLGETPSPSVSPSVSLSVSLTRRFLNQFSYPLEVLKIEIPLCSKCGDEA